VGEDSERLVDVRLLTATHRDLAALQRRGQFREDLYHRISVLTLDVPPLRERGEDIILLAEHFLSELAPEGRVFRLSPDAVSKLRAHAFPGNVRELRNALTRAIVLAQGDVISGADLSLVKHEDLKPQQVNISVAEREAIIKALRESRGSRLTAARALGIARSTLYRKMEEHGIGDNEIFPRR
jgi:two-component system NtrC family response regulator